MDNRRSFLKLLFSATLLASTGGMRKANALITGISQREDGSLLGMITININDYPELATVNGSVLITIDGLPLSDRCAGQEKIIVTRVSQSAFTALSARCTHQGCCTSPYQHQQNAIVCSCHGSRFDAHGNVLQGPATQPLKKYDTNFDDPILTITIPGLVDVTENIAKETELLQVYPNPCRENATLVLSIAKPETIRIECSTLNGKRLFTLGPIALQAGLFRIPIHLSDVPDGIYLLRIILNSGREQQVAITVQH